MIINSDIFKVFTMKKYLSQSVTLIVFIIFNSCSLVKIESEQKPLSQLELNTRLLTQEYIKTASERVEKGADSLLEISSDIEIQKNALKWKINTLRSLRQVGFQTSPKLALLDCWSISVAVKDFFQSDSTKKMFTPYNNIPINISKDNLRQIEKIASMVLPSKEFNKHKDFVEAYAKSNPVYDLNLDHRSIRESYFDFKNIPDSLAIETVGSLSEVVNDLSNRITYTSDNTGKSLRWNTELFLKEKGIDTTQIKILADSLDVKFSKLVELAEKSPVLIDDALNKLQGQLNSFNWRIDQNMNTSLEHLSEERKKLIEFLISERRALDKIIARERELLTNKADELSSKLVEQTMGHTQELIKTSLIYLIILLAVIIILPFSMGYYLGKRLRNSKNN